jgi:alkaline phosphatase
MKLKNTFILTFILFTHLFTAGCSKEKPTRTTQLYKNLVNLESEFWFQHSTAHVLLNRMVSKQTQVVWSTNFHTAAPVPIGAVGPQKYTNMLKGIIHNDSIGRVLKDAVAHNINVILVIGDGMGNMHMALPVYMRYAQKDKTLTMFERIMKEGTCGYVFTSTARGLVTGSAASGTAIATGTKTIMNMIATDSAGISLESALSVAKRRNYRTALVSNAGITDATPAVFYAHSPNRDWENRIARELFNCNQVDVILGGGGSHFIPQGTHLSDYVTGTESEDDYQSSREDSLNLIEQFKKASYTFCCNLEQMQNAFDSQKVLGLFAGGGLPAPIDRDNTNSKIPTLPQMGEEALKIISKNKSQYFAMIECARIDWEAHDNDAGAVYNAVENMNRVLKIAYRFYQKAPEKTLLIFTADHETGGLEIAYRKMPESQMMSKKLKTGEIWTNNTNPLPYDQYIKNLKQQKRSISRVFRQSHSAEELKQNVRDYLGFILSEQDARLLFFSMNDYRRYKE